MKRLLSVLVVALLVLSCSSQKEDHQKVSESIEKFYSTWNSRNFKSMEEICTVNMVNFIKKLRKEKDYLVKYKKYTVNSVDIVSGVASTEVECTDEFDNVIVMKWNLIRQDNKWKVNNYNGSYIMEQYNKSVSDTSKNSKSVSDLTTTQTTEIREENDNADKKDTLYN